MITNRAYGARAGGPARRILARGAVALAFAAVALSAAGCGAQSSDISLSGRIDDDTVSVAAPTFAAPRSKPTTVAALARLGQVSRVVSVPVAVGDHVGAGDVVAHLDDSALAAEVQSARALQRLAAARVGVLGARLDDVADARATIAQTRATVRKAIADLTAARADLASKLSAARTQLADLRALLARLQQLPPGSTPPPGTPGPTQLASAIAKLEAGIAQMEAGLAKMDAGLAKARGGLAKLETASATAADARQTLEGLRDVARRGTAVSDIAVELTQARRDLATLRSPVDGTVVAAVRQGEALAPGSPVVTIRPDTASSVSAYITPQQRAQLTAGANATVRIDSLPGEVFSATVTLVGTRAVYPPSWFTTTETHMTRSFLVRVTLQDSTVRLPAGTPADVQIKL